MSQSIRLRNSCVMRKVLIICDTFPPQSFVGGLRPAMFAKYLPEFGWEPFVLTREWPIGDPRRSAMMHLDGLPGTDHIHRCVFSSEEERAAAKRSPIRQRIDSMLRPDRVFPAGLVPHFLSESVTLWPDVSFDAVLPTIPDLYPLTVGADLARRRGARLVADLRDIAEQEDGAATSLRDRFHRWRMRRRRNQLLRAASMAIVVSQSHKRIIEGCCQAPTHVVYNGHDGAAYGPLNPEQPTIFRILYLGRLLSTWYRDPTVLFEALDLLLSRGAINPQHVCVDFYGTEPELLKPVFAGRACAGLVHIVDRVEHAEAIRVLGTASVLLVLTNRGRKGILTSKFFEYLPTKKPILCVPGDGDELDQLLGEHAFGESAGTPEAVANALLTWYGSWLRGESAKSKASDVSIAKFSRRAQTAELATLLNRCVESNAGQKRR